MLLVVRIEARGSLDKEPEPGPGLEPGEPQCAEPGAGRGAEEADGRNGEGGDREDIVYL